MAVACAARVAARCLLLSACLCGVACAFVFVPLLAAFATKNLRSCFFSFMSCAPLSSYLGSEIKAVRDPSMILSWCLLSFSFSRFLSSCLLCFASFAVLSRAPCSFPLCGLLRPALRRDARRNPARLPLASSPLASFVLPPLPCFRARRAPFLSAVSFGLLCIALPLRAQLLLQLRRLLF